MTPADRPGRPAELTLKDLVQPLWESRYAIAAVGVLCAAAVVAYQVSIRPSYDAVAVVRVVASKSEDQAEPARAENFRPLLENKTIADGLVKDFNLVRMPRFRWGGPGRPIPADRFVTEILAVAQVAGTNLLQVRIRLSDAQQAAAVANALVERASDLNRRISQQEVVDARDYIKTQLDEASTRLEQVRGELVAVKQRSQVEALQQDADSALKGRSRLAELQASIENERAFLGRSEADLAQSRQLLITRRSIDSEPALVEAARERAPGTSVIGLSIVDEQVNTAYSQLERQVTESRAKLAGLENEQRLLAGNRRRDQAVPLLGKLYEGEVAVSRLQAEYEMTLNVYTELSIRYADARIRVVGRGAQLQLVDPAVPPTIATSPALAPAVALGLLCGVLLACVWVLGRRLLVPLLLP